VSLRAGLAEVIKYGLICDAPFFDWIEANMDALLAADPPALAHVVQRSCEIRRKSWVGTSESRVTARSSISVTRLGMR